MIEGMLVKHRAKGSKHVGTVGAAAAAHADYALQLVRVRKGPAPRLVLEMSCVGTQVQSWQSGSRHRGTVGMLHAAALGQPELLQQRR
jgi:hypothetical protein